MGHAALVGRTALAAFGIVAGTARGQELHGRAYGTAAYDQFGASIEAGGPDLDGDGVGEIAVSSRVVPPGSPVGNGAVTILSGKTFVPLQTLSGPTAGEAFGFRIAWCADVDGDGIDDLAVGCPLASIAARNFEGRVRIFSTSSWTQVREHVGGATYGELGFGLARLRDVNADGISDLLVSAPGEVTATLTSGVLYVYSGSDGALIRTITVTPSEFLGMSVADVGDVDADGVTDLGAGDPWADYVTPEAGFAYVFSGANGSLLYTAKGAARYDNRSYGQWVGDNLGWAIGAAGDWDGDGHADWWALSGYGAGSNPPTPAYLRLFSGSDGSKLLEVGTLTYHEVAAAVGDLNGDGRTELALGGGLSTTRAVLLYSSVDGEEVWRADSESMNWIGIALAGGFDADLDGRPEFAIGIQYDDTFATDAGRVDFLSGDDLWLDLRTRHTVTAGDSMSLGACEGPQGNPAALFLTSVNGTPTFSLTHLSTFGKAGTAQWFEKVPAGFAGTTLTLRAIGVDAAGRLVDSIDETIVIQ